MGVQVRALVRRRDGKRDDEDIEAGTTTSGGAIPAAVDVVQGDVGSMDDCQKAVKGVDKVGPAGCAHVDG